MSSRKDRRERRDVHALSLDGAVLCNPRDREAAHRADVGDVAVTDDPLAVTCARCRALLPRRA